MIRLTRLSGEIEYVNPDRIEQIVDNSGNAQIVFPDGESYPYRESPAEVARKVLEWKIDMQSITNEEYSVGARKRLFELAGLEEQGHD